MTPNPRIHTDLRLQAAACDASRCSDRKDFICPVLGKHKGNGGKVFLSSLHLKLARREWLANSNGYDGEVFDWISSEAVKDDTLSWNDRGPTLGDVSGAGFGVIAHELAHCFNPPPQENGEHGPEGLLMGNGCRGIRLYFQPKLTGDRCKLRNEDAAAFEKSDFFRLTDAQPQICEFLMTSQQSFAVETKWKYHFNKNGRHWCYYD